MHSDLDGDRPGAPLHAMQRFTAPVQQPPVTAPSPTCQATRQFSGVAQPTESAGRHSGGRAELGKTALQGSKGWGSAESCAYAIGTRTGAPAPSAAPALPS